MARIRGVDAKEAGLIVRIAYWMTKRMLGRVIEPVRIMAHHPRLLRATGAMENGQAAARTVDVRLKALAQIKAALLIGCPF